MEQGVNYNDDGHIDDDDDYDDGDDEDDNDDDKQNYYGIKLMTMMIVMMTISGLLCWGQRKWADETSQWQVGQNDHMIIR